MNQIETIIIDRSRISEAALVLAGELNNRSWMKPALLRYGMLTAADGGNDRLESIGLHPGMWIGDGDTVQHMPGPQIERIRLPVNKDLSDGEAAVNLLTTRFMNVDIYCGLGNEFEHHHASLQLLLVRPGRVIIREKGLIILAVDPFHSLVLEGMLNAIVSVFSASDKVIADMNGFQWNMDAEELVPQTRGLLNVVKSQSARISSQQGRMFVYIRFREDG